MNREKRRQAGRTPNASRSPRRSATARQRLECVELAPAFARGSWKARRESRSPTRTCRDPAEEDAREEFGAPFHGCSVTVLKALRDAGGAFDEERAAAHFAGGGGRGLAEEIADESAEGFIGGPIAGVIDVMLQLVEQFVGVRETTVDLPGQRAVQNVVEPVIDAPVQPPEIR